MCVCVVSVCLQIPINIEYNSIFRALIFTLILLIVLFHVIGGGKHTQRGRIQINCIYIAHMYTIDAIQNRILAPLFRIRVIISYRISIDMMI